MPKVAPSPLCTPSLHPFFISGTHVMQTTGGLPRAITSARLTAEGSPGTTTKSCRWSLITFSGVRSSHCSSSSDSGGCTRFSTKGIATLPEGLALISHVSRPFRFCRASATAASTASGTAPAASTALRLAPPPPTVAAAAAGAAASSDRRLRRGGLRLLLPLRLPPSPSAAAAS